jgi:protein O-GlcNAc transferase
MSQAMLELARQHHSAGRLDLAEPLYRQFLETHPDHPETLALLGALYYQQSRPADAVAFLTRAATANPNSPELRFNLGLAHCAKEDWPAAIASFQTAIDLRPDYASAHNGLGNCLRATGQLPQAVESYRKAASLKPDSAGFLNNLGIALQSLGQTPESIEVFQRALNLKPDYAEALSNLANVLWLVGRPQEAAGACQRALALNPKLTSAWNNLGNSLRDSGQISQATEAYSKAVELDPRNAGFASNLIYMLHFQPDLDPAEVFRRHTDWNTQFAAPLSDQILPHPNDKTPTRRLRIGYISPDFRDHSVAYFLLELFAHHDPWQFEIFAYSDVAYSDAMTARLQKSVPKWRNIVGQTDAALADIIRNDKIDILIDLAGHTGHNRLLTFARKPAPIQITHIGYPYTTGLTAIDYRFTDQRADPPGMTERFHSEKIIRLPNTFLCFSPPSDAPDPSPPPLSKSGQVTFGSFNALSKISSVSIDLWSRILRAVPNSRLTIKSSGGLAEDVPRNWLLDQFQAAGISPDRIDLRKRIPSPAGHLQLYNEIDIALDTYPYHGTKTTCDALWMSVPVITLAGPTHPSRVGVSLLTTVGLSDLIAQSPDDYVTKATQLANNLPTLTQIRATLREKMRLSPLCDGKKFAAAIEAAYRQMWSDYCRE